MNPNKRITIFVSTGIILGLILAGIAIFNIETAKPLNSFEYEQVTITEVTEGVEGGRTIYFFQTDSEMSNILVKSQNSLNVGAEITIKWSVERYIVNLIFYDYTYTVSDFRSGWVNEEF